MLFFCRLLPTTRQHCLTSGYHGVNPYLFGKGDWQDVSRLRLEVNYDDIKGKTFKTVCEYNDKKESGESETDQPLPRTGTEG